MSKANVHKSVHNWHENGSRRSLREPFYLVAGTLVAGTGFEPATSRLRASRSRSSPIRTVSSLQVSDVSRPSCLAASRLFASVPRCSVSNPWPTRWATGASPCGSLLTKRQQVSSPGPRFPRFRVSRHDRQRLGWLSVIQTVGHGPTKPPTSSGWLLHCSRGRIACFGHLLSAAGWGPAKASCSRGLPTPVRAIKPHSLSTS